VILPPFSIPCLSLLVRTVRDDEVKPFLPNSTAEETRRRPEAKFQRRKSSRGSGRHRHRQRHRRPNHRRHHGQVRKEDSSPRAARSGVKLIKLFLRRFCGCCSKKLMCLSSFFLVSLFCLSKARAHPRGAPNNAQLQG
jgi:hypothetical protein